MIAHKSFCTTGIWVASLLLSTSFALAAAQTTGKSHVQASLVANRSATAPGDDLLLAVRLKMDPHWHVYWQNPGDSGMAPQIKWQTPAGVKIGPIKWPVPQEFDGPGDLVGYGYTDEVWLIVPVKIDPSLRTGTTLHITADVDWLVCEALCIPGQAKLEIDLPVAEQAAATNESDFQQWQKRWPIPIGDSDQLALAEARLRMPEAGQSSWGGLSVNWTDKPRDVQWFPLPGQQIQISNVTARTYRDQKLSRVQFLVLRFSGSKEPDSLTGVLAYTDDQGQRRGVWIDLGGDAPNR